MNGLSLCAGIGGLDLGLHLAIPGYRTVCYVEIEPYCQEVLLARMADGVLDRAPIWGDLRVFDARPWRGLVDIVHGGYPCQPFSVAGRRRGAEDPRHLWPHVARVVAETEAPLVFLENVAGHVNLGFREVAGDLERMGYVVAAGLFTAAEVGAPHRRQRLFILAAPMGHPHLPRLEGRSEPEREGPDGWPPWPPGPEERDRWQRVLAAWSDLAPAVAPEPSLRGVAHGLPRRVDRLRALGNAVVPDVAALAFRTLAEWLSL